MTITTLSSREFNQDTSRAKKAAQEGPVFITDRGEPAHMLLSIAEYRKLTGGRISLAEALAQPDAPRVDDFDFDPPRLEISFPPPELVPKMTIVTRNAADFEATGATIFKPWLRH